MTASCIGCAASEHCTTLPSFRRAISPALSSTRRCFMKPGKDMPCACASVDTDWLPLPSASSTCRRVGSDSAAKTSLSTSSAHLTMRFNIASADRAVKIYPSRGTGPAAPKRRETKAQTILDASGPCSSLKRCPAAPPLQA